MNTSPHTCHAIYDFAYDLVGNSEKNANDTCENNHGRLAKCVHMQICINGLEEWALLDSGSQVTCISEELYNNLNSINKCRELPTTNLYVATAIGKKSTTIRKQILVEINLNGDIFDYPFLVIPYLATNVILGHDWFIKNNIILNYKTGDLEVRNKVIPTDQVLFERGALDKIIVHEENEITYVHIVKVNEGKNINKLNNEKCEIDILTAESNDKYVNKNINNVDVNVKNINYINIFQYNNLNNIQIYTDYVDEEKHLIINGYELINVNNIQNIDLNSDVNSAITLSDELRSIASNLTTLDSFQKSTFISLLEKFDSIFSDKPGCAVDFKHHIRIIKDKPVVRKNYPVPYAMRAATDKAINEMLNLGIIERSISNYCNPLRVLLKKDKTARVCLDARFINKYIEEDLEPPPLMNEVIQKHHGAKFFSKIDLTNGYWQVQLDDESRKYTAFLYNNKVYQYTRVPFGFRDAGSAFLRMLSKAVGDDNERVSRFVDDILISSPTVEQHMNDLEWLFEKLANANLKIKLSKCEFFKESVTFLGVILSIDGIRPDPEKLSIIANFEEPRNKRDLQSFLGVCNFYRQFSLYHAYLVDPFRNLLKNNHVWRWKPEHSIAYRNLKENFLRCVTLEYIVPGRKLKVQTDACDRGISGVLYQVDENCNHGLLAVVSRCLSACEMQWSTTEKELLAIVYAVTKFHTYLIGNSFELITDHKSLTFLLTTTFLNSRLKRWCLLLTQYNFTITHCKGSENIVADFLSRHPGGRFYDETNENLIISSLNYMHDVNVEVTDNTCLVAVTRLKQCLTVFDDFKKISDLQRNDLKLGKIISNLENGEKNEYMQIYENILFQKHHNNNTWRIVVPNKLQSKLAKEIHQRLGHVGVYKTSEYIKSFYTWKGLNKTIKAHVLSCDLCQRTKYPNMSMENEFKMVRADTPNELITVDFYGPLPRSRFGVEYIFVIIDAFSKYVKLYPLKKATTRACLKKLFDHYIPECGKPMRILSDNGTQFTANLWRIELEKNDIKVTFSSVRHPESNPTERVMRELGRFFRSFCTEKHSSWSDYVSRIENLMNITTHYSTRFPPKFLHYGLPVEDDIQKIIKYPSSENQKRNHVLTLAKENLLKNFRKRKNQQKSITKIKLNVGDLVLLRVRHLSNALDKTTRKFFHLFEGPYKISKMLNNSNSFVLVEVNNENVEKGIYNQKNLRKYNVASDDDT